LSSTGLDDAEMPGASGEVCARPVTLPAMGELLRTPVRMPVSILLTSRRTVDLCRVGSCLCRFA
jgi:hypothetical protein